jgi:iron complex outermembrane receptor protein
MKTVNVRIAAAVALALAGVQAGFAAEGEELEEVQVTGSRITLAPGMSTPTPVTSVLAEEMESLGPNQIIDSLNALPVFRNNSTANGSLGGQNSGGANVNMHGIGANRTLTLLDGRRLVATNRFGSVDVNILPSMLFRNVETVTGGASASYGTDAVAGVTNFILDTRFEGVELQGSDGRDLPQRWRQQGIRHRRRPFVHGQPAACHRFVEPQPAG